MKALPDQGRRYVRIPRPLKRSTSKKLSFVSLKSLVEAHRRSIHREKKSLGINDYALLWIFFFRGVLVTIIVERYLAH